jgi:ParB family transcriptional regulator, chromosome partitioning protein
MAAEVAGGKVLMVALGQLLLGPSAVRRRFDEDALNALAISLQSHGQLQPLLVRRFPSALPRALFEVIVGERRLLAARRAGLETLAVVVHGVSDSQALELALVENLQRTDLNELEEAEGLVRLVAVTLSCTPEAASTVLYRLDNELRGRVPRSRLDGSEGVAVRALFERVGGLTLATFVAKRLPLLALSEDLRVALGAGRLRPAQARLIARVSDLPVRASLIDFVAAQRPTLSALRARIEGVREARVAPTWVGALRGLREQLERVPLEQRERALALLGELESVLVGPKVRNPPRRTGEVAAGARRGTPAPAAG